MTEETGTKEVRKLTAEDLPDLAGDAASPESSFYCRFYKQTASGWEEVRCSGDYSSESACASASGYAGADGYTWTTRAC